MVPTVCYSVLSYRTEKNLFEMLLHVSFIVVIIKCNTDLSDRVSPFGVGSVIFKNSLILQTWQKEGVSLLLIIGGGK